MIQDPSALANYPRGDIRTGAGAMTRFVERRLASRYGWNLEVFQGREPVFPGSRTGGFYRVLNPARYFVRPWAPIHGLRIAEWLRFGNSVLQLIHAFAFAERYGARHLYLPSRHQFYQDIDRGIDRGIDRKVGAGEVELHWGREHQLSGLAVSGYFLHMRALMPPLEVAVQRSIVERHIRPRLAEDLRQADPRVGADDLVMHFRGGDAFDTEDVKTGYWQPPLAYYLAVFEHDRPKRVWIVSEDRRNPTIAGLEEALRRRGVEVLVQSGTLREDLRVLLSARRLVASVGTFVPAVALLSSRVETFYQFGRHPNPLLALLGVRLVNAFDAQGDFMEQVAGRWRASPENLAMMMSYPLDRIRIEAS